MTYENLAQNCAVATARSLSDSALCWGQLRVANEYQQYLQRYGVDADTLDAIGDNVLSSNEFTLLYLLNKFTEYYYYLVGVFKTIDERDLSLTIAMQLVSNLYIERFGCTLVQFLLMFGTDFRPGDFMDSERLTRVVSEDDDLSLSMTRDVLPGANTSVSNMLSTQPTIRSVHEYQLIYKTMVLLANVVVKA